MLLVTLNLQFYKIGALNSHAYICHQPVVSTTVTTLSFHPVPYLIFPLLNMIETVIAFYDSWGLTDFVLELLQLASLPLLINLAFKTVQYHPLILVLSFVFGAFFTML